MFLPLGGCGEIGMNLNLYGFGPEGNRKWIIVDCGVTFGDSTTPGVEVITPDPSFIVERRQDLLAIVLTHAHEDHMGAVARLWPQLRAPIYATPFTAWLVRDRLKEAGLLGEAKVHDIALDARFDIGPFDLQLITLTHSIPEPNGLAIRTPAGLVLHTGDWKIDPDPVIGATTDDAALRALGEEGVLAMVCDSTNVFNPGEAGSEGDVRRELVKVIGEQTGRVAVAAFASNVARLESVMSAAAENDRHVALVGRSMHRMTAAAKAVGLLKGVPDTIEEDDAGFLPPEKVLYLCTGSQGEPRAALSRIASGSHRSVVLSKGDTVLFSSRVIPGNETAINALQNGLVDSGINVITDRQRPIHVSGHPCRDELRQMYQWARPRVAIPVHGEARHIEEHATFAKSLQIPEALAPRNGALIRLAPGPAEIIDHVEAGRWHADGAFLVPSDDDALRERKRLSYNGNISIALALDAKGRLVGGPDVRARGLPEDEEDDLQSFLDEAAEEAGDAYRTMNRSDREDEDKVESVVTRAVRKLAQEVFNRRPLVDAIVLRV